MPQGKMVFMWVVIGIGVLFVLLSWGAWEGLLRTQVFTGESPAGGEADERNRVGNCRCFCFGPAADPERAALGYTVALDTGPRAAGAALSPQTKDYPGLTRAACEAQGRQETCEGYRVALDGSSELVQGVYDGCGLLEQE